MPDKDKNKKKDRKQQFHRDLEGFDIKINPFGEIESSYDVDKLNEFLNKRLDDPRLKKGEDQEE